MPRAVGVDLGGTNVRVALIGVPEATDAEPERLGETRGPVGPDVSPQNVARRIAAMVAELGPGDAEVPVGVGLAGMLRGSTGVVSNAPNLGWRDVPFRQLLEGHLGGRRIELYNDVNAIAFGETRYGAGRGAGDVLCVFPGTGIGGGYVAGGRLIVGASGSLGEIGHTKVSLSADAPDCHCGQKGCIEAYAGGRVLVERIGRDIDSGAPGTRRILELAGGEPGAIHPGHLDAAAAEGDPYATGIYNEVTPLLGMVLANAVTLLNPHRLVMGGGMWRRSLEFQRRVLAAFPRARRRRCSRDRRGQKRDPGRRRRPPGLGRPGHRELTAAAIRRRPISRWCPANPL